MNFKRINIILSVFWLVASILIVILDINGVIHLAQNHYLFFGLVISMFASFKLVTYFEKKVKKNQK